MYFHQCIINEYNIKVYNYLITVLSKFCNHLDEEEIAGCFAFIVFLMSCDCWCSVNLPNSALGWSAVCDCGIF